jgi:ArsR family transcriptional regulator
MEEQKTQTWLLQAPVTFDRALKVLSDPTRLEIIRLLGNTDDLCCRTVPEDSETPRFGLCVQDLVAHMKQPQSTVSHHLSMLRNVGLVNTQKDGACVYYMRNDIAINALKQALNNL